MICDLAINNGTVVSGTAAARMHVGIVGDKVAALSSKPDAIRATSTIDAEGLLVFPGCIDAHVHFREPGAAHKEGFETGTKAAAAGGITTVMVMPTDDPPTVTAERYDAKVRLTEGRRFANVALLCGVGPDLDDLPAIAARGVIGAEVFLGGLAKELRIDDNAQLLRTMSAIARCGMVAGVTPNDDAIVAERTAALRNAGQRDAAAFVRSRPPEAEAFGVARACIAASAAGGRVHVRQVSCGGAVDLIAFYKRTVPRLTAEVFAHSLALSDAEMPVLGPHGVMSPPLRSASDVASLWRGIEDRTIDIVASDHAPHLASEKERGRDDIWNAPLGIPGVQTLLPVLLDAAHAGRLRYERIAEVLCEAPAKIFGLHPRKGTIAIGADADLVVIDPRRRTLIRNEDQYSKAGVTPFHGREMTGSPVFTLVNGVVAAQAGRVVGHPAGRILTRHDVH